MNAHAKDGPSNDDSIIDYNSRRCVLSGWRMLYFSLLFHFAIFDKPRTCNSTYETLAMSLIRCSAGQNWIAPLRQNSSNPACSHRDIPSRKVHYSLYFKTTHGTKKMWSYIMYIAGGLKISLRVI